MSMALIDLARNFLDESLSGKSFTKKFFEMWRSEGASGLLKKDDDNLGVVVYSSRTPI
ncbi:colicin immunity domain-containing protein [Pseudomonas aeruginosa]